MDIEKLEVMENRKGFIAALDQSGGSSGKTLELYGINKNRYNNDSEMFNLINGFRKRIVTNSNFISNKIVGVILFEQTLNMNINNKNIVDYLWDDKKIVSFLKIDKGLEETANDVKLMKQIPNLENTLDKAKKLGILGTKMRSVIYNNNREGIKNIVKQQFDLARIILSKGLIPIIEPEVDISSVNKKECEIILKEELDKELNLLDEEAKIIFKLSIPSIPNFYQDYINHKNVIKVLALSGGYPRDKACNLLSKNNGMIASFSRALLENLRENQSEEEFGNILKETIDDIYIASIT